MDEKSHAAAVKYGAAIDHLLRKLLVAAERHFKRSFPPPTITYNQRGRAAGTARFHEWSIRLNPQLLLENGSTFINEVLPHEVAHLITDAVTYPKRIKPHGEEWRFVLEEVFKCKARTRHNFNTDSVKGRTFLYQCRCREYELSLIRHNKVRRGAIYRCNFCYTPLFYKKEGAN